MVISPKELLEFVESAFEEVLKSHRNPDQSQRHKYSISPSDLSLLPGLIEDMRPRPRTTADQLTLKRMVVHLGAHIKDAQTPTEMAGRKIYFPLSAPYLDKRPLLLALVELLQRCPERELLDDSGIFDYVIDSDYRNTLLADLLETEDVLKAGNWKAATVMSGSLIEALLHYSLSQLHSNQGLAQGLGLNWDKIRPDVLDGQGLSYFIKRATEFDLIDNKLRAILDEARDFRNLVHAGKAKREKATCGKGTGRLRGSHPT